MADTVPKHVRSRMMSSIRGSNTKPEMTLRRAMHARGFRYRLHDRRLPGRPDLVFPRYGVVLFVHGCFWHRHEGCKYATTPASNVEFWQEKFENNVARDKSAIGNLQEAGWRVGVVWECLLRDRNREDALADIGKFLTERTEGYLEWPMLSP
ncbi:very short patch repair endonuclease [Oricola sp.]|uniref:very short patch repair endonuclease n=1 Tax=Oricola sp. TaxID=1979950 RepID=UPI003516F32F